MSLVFLICLGIIWLIYYIYDTIKQKINNIVNGNSNNFVNSKNKNAAHSSKMATNNKTNIQSNNTKQKYNLPKSR